MKKLSRIWKKITQRLWRARFVIGVIALLLLTARLVLPFAVRSYVNHKLKHVQEFSGHVDGVRIDLYRGAYTVVNLRLAKTNAYVNKPFLLFPEMDLAIEWKELFRGAVVGKVTLVRPEVNFFIGPGKKEKQTGTNANLQQVLDALFPFTLNRFDVHDGTINYYDPYRPPGTHLFVTNLYASATNLSNTRKKSGPLPAGLRASGHTLGGGTLRIELHMNPMAPAPTFKLDASLTNLDLPALNDFLRAYGNFDVTAGQFAVYADVAAADGQYHGQAKPFFFNLDVLSWKKDADKSFLQKLWEFIIAGVGEIFRNQPRNQVATVVPLSGTFEEGANVDLFATIGGILRNAFVQALVPGLNRGVPLPGQGNRARPPQTSSKKNPSKHETNQLSTATP